MRLQIVILWILVYGLSLNVTAGEDEGKVRFVSGDLVYISGMNGSAPEGSQLAAVNTTAPSLVVIKHLDDMVVARKLDPRADLR